MPATAEPTAMMTTSEVAELLRVDPLTVRVWGRTGRLPAPIRLSRKTLLWDRAEIEAFLEQRKTEPRESGGAA